MEFVIFLAILALLEYLLTGRYRDTPNVPKDYKNNPHHTAVHQSMALLNFNKKPYLQSFQWKDRRRQVLKRDNYTCQKCLTDGISLDVHHLHYANIGREPLADLVSLCRDCHDKLHKNLGYSNYNKFPI